MKRSVMFARFPFGASDHPDTTNWLVETVLKAKSDPRIGEVHRTHIDDTPITMSRNLAVKRAQQAGADILVFIDSDMRPDLKYPGARPFWDSSLDFLLAQERPSIVAAPYCGRPPNENVFVFRWFNMETGQPNPDMKLENVSRDNAAYLAGFEEVGAIGTGLMMIDMRVFERLPPPYFYYEWTDATQSEKGSTEDVTFTRDAAIAGCGLFCNWDAWAGHHKLKCVYKPKMIGIDQVRDNLHAALLRGVESGEREIIMHDGVPLGQPYRSDEEALNGHRAKPPHLPGVVELPQALRNGTRLREELIRNPHTERLHAVD